MRSEAKALMRALPAVIAAALALGACNDSTEPSPVTVNVTLREFNITLDRASVPRGTVIFHVSNAGEDIHEFLVIRTDRAPNALPTEANGSYQENGPGTQLLEEIEEVPPGSTRDLTIDLTEGAHVLICNMVMTEADGTVEVHYALGMHAAFRVD
jgi:iron uptake system component EfeO